MQSPSSTSVSTSTIAVPLVQGLHNGDRELINYCLSQGASASKNSVNVQSVIFQTLLKFPNDSIIPFLDYLVQKLENHPKQAHIAIPWIKPLLLSKSTFLAHAEQLHRSPNGLLVRLFDVLQYRTRDFDKLNQLQGRLDLATYKIKASTNPKKLEAARIASLLPKQLETLSVESNSNSNHQNSSEPEFEAFEQVMTPKQSK